MSQESKKEEMFLSGFTIKGITIAVLTILIGFPIAFLLQNMSTKPATYTGFWLSPIQLVIVFELLRRENRIFKEDLRFSISTNILLPTFNVKLGFVGSYCL